MNKEITKVYRIKHKNGWLSKLYTRLSTVKGVISFYRYTDYEILEYDVTYVGIVKENL